MDVGEYPEEKRLSQNARPEPGVSIPFRSEDTPARSVGDTNDKDPRDGHDDTNSLPRPSSKGHSRIDGSVGGNDDERKSFDATDRPTLESIFADTNQGSTEIFRAGVTDQDHVSSKYDRRQVSSQSPDPEPRRRRLSHGLQRDDHISSRGYGHRASPGVGESTYSPGRRAVSSNAPRLLSETQHAAKSLAIMGEGRSGQRRAKTRAELKEKGRAREWVDFCRRKTHLSLQDLSKEERPRTAKKEAVTPFALNLIKVCRRLPLLCARIVGVLYACSMSPAGSYIVLNSGPFAAQWSSKINRHAFFHSRLLT